MVAHVRMIAGEHEDGVLEPRLTAGGLEELADGHIRIADALLDLEVLLRELLAIALRHHEGVMAGGCEDGRHEGLLQFTHLLGIELQEGLVPDGPGAVEVVSALGGLKFRATIVALETGLLGKGLETHAAVFCPMEEGGLIALGP